MQGVMEWETTASVVWCNRCQMDVIKNLEHAPRSTRDRVHSTVLTQLIV